eukprot:TRINITY_DN14960_c0_g1_i1.p1 TRINITY_DN14960_c0_g1~~TRINITY_DN14960_c0_g1_i1.p1  ORF type:complete len:424 (+),score=70.57 TRINITY_DN14960_c0_g1_i1:65-1336(+)
MSWADDVMKAAVSSGPWAGAGAEDATHAFVWHVPTLRRTARRLRKAFPADSLHAFAAKANPVLPILDILCEEGMGCEVASHGEFTQAMRAFPQNRVVYDGPCKTKREVLEALNTECIINVDNLQELEIMKQHIAGGGKPKAQMGIRVNPQIGAGTLSAFSTGTATSKFGVPIADLEKLDLREWPWITCLSLHTGSQGCGLDLMVEGVKTVVKFARKYPQINTIDIGGGLSVDFTSDDWEPPFELYAERLRREAPDLFRYRIVTEFGRSVAAKSGVLISRIEYTKEAGGRRIVTQHAGVDLAIRTVWAPKEWPLRVNVYSETGDRMPDVDVGVTDVAGPCCLGGDILAHQRNLPRMRPGCYVLFKDVGAYYHASYSYYNLRQAPSLWAYAREGVAGSMALLLQGQSLEETLSIMTPKKRLTSRL